MSWTKTPPTKEGYYFWRMFPKDCYSILEIIKEDGILKFCDSDGEFPIAGLGGEWWDSPVPEPGTTFSVEEISRWLMSPMIEANHVVYIINHPKHGIAAVTNKEKHDSEKSQV